MHHPGNPSPFAEKISVFLPGRHLFASRQYTRYANSPSWTTLKATVPSQPLSTLEKNLVLAGLTKLQVNCVAEDFTNVTRFKTLKYTDSGNMSNFGGNNCKQFYLYLFPTETG
jgi:hypothetical protein